MDNSRKDTRVNLTCVLIFTFVALSLELVNLVFTGIWTLLHWTSADNTISSRLGQTTTATLPDCYQTEREERNRQG